MDTEEVLKRILICDANATQAYEEAERKSKRAAADAKEKMDNILAEAFSSAQTEANRIETEARAEFDAQAVHENRKRLDAEKLEAMRQRFGDALGELQHILLEG